MMVFCQQDFHSKELQTIKDYINQKLMIIIPPLIDLENFKRIFSTILEEHKIYQSNFLVYMLN